MSDFDPLTLGDTPDNFVENDDGSVTISDEALDVEGNDSEFYDNLVEYVASSELREIASEYLEHAERDRDARKKRDQQQEEGLRRSGLGDDAPGGAQFDGASRVVSPIIAESCVDFSARAIKELFPPQGPVRTYIIGSQSSEAIERSERKRQYLNWQLSTQMEEYRSELEQLLTQLPLGGSQYQKFWYDERTGKPVSEFVPVDEIYIPFAASSLYSASRVTHRQLLTKYEFKRRVRAGLYKEIDLLTGEDSPERSDSSIANDKIEGRTDDAYNEDGVRAVLEIYTWLNLDDDDLTSGDPAPYIVTIDEYTEEVLSIYRNWEEGDDSLTKLDWLVEWKFIPWRGAYGIGLTHLIGGLSAAATGALRALMDSAHISNAPTLLKLKGSRVVGQTTSIDVTQMGEIEGPAGTDDVRKVAMPLPFNGPSPVLFQLLGFLTDSAKGVIATADEKLNNVGDRTPVGTTMALVEAGSTTYSAIHARLHESQKRALKILCRINRQWLDEEEVIEDLGQLIISRSDFINSSDVIPVSDPAIFSESQRFAQSQALMQMASQDAQNPNVPWNQVEVRRRMLKQLRVDGIDELLPAQKKPISDDPLTEADQVLRGAQVVTSPHQDHLAHIQAHLAFITSPLQIHNPLVAPQALSALLAHVGEHIQVYQQAVLLQLAKRNVQMMQQNPDSAAAMALQQGGEMLLKQLSPYMQQIEQIQQELQKRTPPPALPPEVQASLQIAQMDTQRKSQYDQATIQMKQAELQASQQMSATEVQMKQAREQFEMQQKAQAQQFEQYMSQLQSQNDARHAEMIEQVKLHNNELDNKQHAYTELSKNDADNRTNLLIEQMKLHMGNIEQKLQQSPQMANDSGVDISPQMKKMQEYMELMAKREYDESIVSVKDSMTSTNESLKNVNDVLASVMQGLKSTADSINKPKMLVRDANGKIIGVKVNDD